MRFLLRLLVAVAIALIFIPCSTVAMATDGGHCVVGSVDASKTWYFAEGYTGEGFQEYLCIGNPQPTAADTVVRYIYKDGTTSELYINVPSGSRATVNVNTTAGSNKEVSAEVTANQEIVVERSMYFEYKWEYSGGHSTVGAKYAANEWYFAEGYTGAGFEEYICILNPGDSWVWMDFYFQTQETGEIINEGHHIPPNARMTYPINETWMLGEGYQHSLKIKSTGYIVAERAIYFEYGGRGGNSWRGGHCVMGQTYLDSDYYFAEGTTRSGFEEWITIQNPHPDTNITVQAEYQLGSGQGEPVQKAYAVPGGSRHTVFVQDEVGPDKDVSVKLTSGANFLAERPMYFSYQHNNILAQGGHCVIGATGTAEGWFMAEGYTGPGFDEWLCIQNPNQGAVDVDVVYFSQERGPIAREHTIEGNSRFTIPVNTDAGVNLQISCGVLSTQPVVVERPMYFNSDFGFVQSPPQPPPATPPPFEPPPMPPIYIPPD